VVNVWLYERWLNLYHVIVVELFCLWFLCVNAYKLCFYNFPSKRTHKINQLSRNFLHTCLYLSMIQPHLDSWSIFTGLKFIDVSLLALDPLRIGVLMGVPFVTAFPILSNGSSSNPISMSFQRK
jgi:hypothetical protein